MTGMYEVKTSRILKIINIYERDRRLGFEVTRDHIAVYFWTRGWIFLYRRPK